MNNLNELTKKHEVVNMGAPNIANLNLSKNQNSPTPTEAIDFLLETLSIKKTMLAALLEITERTLSNWESKDSIASMKNKELRLVAIYNIVHIAIENGVPKEYVLSMLGEPIDPNDNRPLLHFIVDDPNNDLLKTLTLKIAKEYI